MKTNMKKTLICGVMAAAFSACSQQNLHLKGNIANMPDGNICVMMLDSNLQRQIVDTFKIVNGQFDYEGLELDDAECLIFSHNDEDFLMLFVGNETVTVEGDITNPDKVAISGSKYEDVLTDYQDNIPMMTRLAEIDMEMRLSTNDIDKQNSLREETMQIGLIQKAYNDSVIDANKKNPIGPFLLMNLLNTYSFETVDSLTTIFEKELAGHKYVTALRKQIEMARPEYEAQERVKIGCEAPDFELMDIDGKSVKLSDFRGKIVLLDFWASWCAPCRENNKTLVEAYNKFSKMGLEILSISLDKETDEWKTAVKTDGLKGTLLCDPENGTARTYCVKYIPSCFLIDADGEIVSRDAKPINFFEDIEKMLNN